MFHCVLLATFIISCEKEDVEIASTENANASIKSLNTVEITSTGMNFFVPEEIPRGWNTFEYVNGTSVPHFFLLVKIPEDKTLEDYYSEVTVPFNNLLKTWRGEEIPEDETIIADWFWDRNQSYNAGGSGLIDAGETAITSIFLDEPGNYIVECYVKLPNGDFHSVVGMVDQITVTDQTTKSKEPKFDVLLSLDDTGIVLQDEIKRPGLHTFAVDFPQESSADVHLVKIEDAENADRSALNEWMHWGNNMNLPNEGLKTPAPEGFSFLGGTQEVYKGGRTYFQAVLKPGTYVLISEVEDPIASGHYIEFEVQ